MRTLEHSRKIIEAKRNNGTLLHSKESKNKMSLARIGKTHSQKTKEKMSKAHKGIKRPNMPWMLGNKNHAWKGGVHLYSSVHRRLQRAFGVANNCENLNCAKKFMNFDWAVKRGKEYVFDRNNYYTLCRSCHKLYDLGKADIITL